MSPVGIPTTRRGTGAASALVYQEGPGGTYNPSTGRSSSADRGLCAAGGSEDPELTCPACRGQKLSHTLLQGRRLRGQE